MGCGSSKVGVTDRERLLETEREREEWGGGGDSGGRGGTKHNEKSLEFHLAQTSTA